MKQTLTALLLLITLNVFSQSKVRDTTKQKSDTILVMTYPEAMELYNWIDKQNAPHQEIKTLQSFIVSHIKILNQPADKPKK